MYRLKLTNIYKQIKEEETATPGPQYKIYCDMDGVLADFDKRFKDLNPEKLSAAQYQTKYGIEKFWNFIDEENKVKFWVGIPWMPDGKQLWDYIKDKQPTLLSAPSRKPASRLGKRLWVKNNIPGTPLILAAADKKQNYSGRNKILIDDRLDNIEQWVSQGGIGILHKNTQDTIQQLKKYEI
jgi:FMN phosphatase YigB (HAD superfamily)